MTATGEKALTSLRAYLFAVRDLGGDTAAMNAATAQNVLHEDIGYFGEPDSSYNFDEATRDRLLAHARQDASHAVMSAEKAMRYAASTLRWVRLLTIAVLAGLILAVWCLARLG